MIRTFTRFENALKYDYSGFSFDEVLCKSRASLVKGTTFAEQLNSRTKINLIKNFKAKSINNLNKNDLLVKQLIDSDFIYSRKSVDKRVPDIVESTLTIKENNLVCTLDIFKLNKSIKQFIKILEKLDTLKSEQKIQLYVLCKDKYYLHLVNRMSKRYFLRDIIRPCTILPDLSGKLNKDITKYLFILGEYEFSRNFLYKLVYYRISLISKFNLKYERRTFGFYKIQNNLDDYKKLMFLFILIEKVLGKKNPVKNRPIVKKIMLPVMKNVNLQQGNKIHSKVENSRQLIKTSKIKASEPLKNNVNKKIVAKRSSAANNLGSVVPKFKKGPVLANIVKESLGVKKGQKEAALSSTPITKNLVFSNNKRQKQKNGSPIIYKSKRQQWWDAKKNGVNLRKVSSERNQRKNGVKRTDSLNNGDSSTIYMSSKHSPTDSRNSLLTNSTTLPIKLKANSIKKVDLVKEVSSTKPNVTVPVISINKSKAHFIKNANPIKEVYPRKPYMNSSDSNRKKGKYPQPSKK